MIPLIPAKRRSRWLALLLLLGILLAAAAAVADRGYREATQRPGVVHYQVKIKGAALPRPLRIALLSDTHAGRPDMPPARLRKIVDQVNALAPDLILLAGDYIKRAPFGLSAIPDNQAIPPLGGLHARLGVIAVLGNNDCKNHHGDAIAALLKRAGIRVLRDNAALLPGVAVIGTDDIIHCKGNMGPAKIDFARQLREHRLGRWSGGPVIVLTHEPVMAHFAPAYADLAVAGHTHGGQIFPAITGPFVAWQTRSPVARGMVPITTDDGRQMPLLITSGVGTNNLPLRIGVPPEIVLLTIR